MLEVVCQKVLAVDKEEECWRPCLNLHQVAHLECSAILTRQALNLLEGVYPLVKQACRNTSVPLFVDSKDLIHDFTLSLASFSRYESDRDAFGLS